MYVWQLLIYIGIRSVHYDTLCKSRIFLVAKLFLASLCLVRDPNHQSNDRCWRVRKSLIFAKRKYRFISYIRHNVLNSFWKEHSFFHNQMFPHYRYSAKHSYIMNYNTMIVPKFKENFENNWNIKSDDNPFPIK